MLGSTAPHLGNPSGVTASSTCSWLDLALGPGESCLEASSSPFQSSVPASGGTTTLHYMVLLCQGGGG